MRTLTNGPRRQPWAGRAARVAGGNVKVFPNSGYPTAEGASRPAAVVQTPKGAASPYRLEKLPSGERALTRRVCASRHFLHKPPAIAIGRRVLEWAERQGATVVCVLDTEGKRFYRASLATIKARGFWVNRGSGEQRALPLSHWSIIASEQLPLEGI